MNNFVIAILGAFIVGGGVGYVLGEKKEAVTLAPIEHSMSMEDMMVSMNAELQGKSGDDFDKAFLKEMTMHHMGAIEMAELARENAKHEEIKNMAEAIISAQDGEIKQMAKWQEEWYGSSMEHHRQ